MTRIVEIDPREITITPVFKIIEREVVPKSETAGHPVMEMREVVEVRFAGNKNYSPIFPADGFWKREGNQTITYAERWPDAYRAFKEGSPQEASGTPLEMLRPHGVTPEMLSLCRALKIYSIEALFHLEGSAVKTLGMSGNKLKAAAREFMAERTSGVAQLAQIEELQRQIAELQARSTVPPEQEASPEEVDEAIEAADAAYAALTETEMKDLIKDKTGVRPMGNPSRETLLRTLGELDQQAA